MTAQPDFWPQAKVHYDDGPLEGTTETTDAVRVTDPRHDGAAFQGPARIPYGAIVYPLAGQGSSARREIFGFYVLDHVDQPPGKPTETYHYRYQPVTPDR